LRLMLLLDKEVLLFLDRWILLFQSRGKAAMEVNSDQGLIVQKAFNVIMDRVNSAMCLPGFNKLSYKKAFHLVKKAIRAALEETDFLYVDVLPSRSDKAIKVNMKIFAEYEIEYDLEMVVSLTR